MVLGFHSPSFDTQFRGLEALGEMSRWKKTRKLPENCVLYGTNHSHIASDVDALSFIQTKMTKCYLKGRVLSQVNVNQVLIQ